MTIRQRRPPIRNLHPPRDETVRLNVAATWIGSQRPGVVLLLALTALFIVSAFCISFTETILLLQRRADLRRDQYQADLLAQSALNWARLELEQRTTPFETVWEVTLPGDDRGEASFQVDPGLEPDSQIVTVQARVPGERGRPVAATRRAILHIPTRVGP